MKRSRRLTALLLCMLMIIPSQGMSALAEAIEGTGRISETLPLEVIEGAEEETSRIEETLALEPMKENMPDEWIIYWNPGGVLPENLATASNAQAAASDTQTATASNARVATASNAKKGSDDADGRTPSTPVKTLTKALERAAELMAEEALLPADITIYAMNPMEVADRQLYALNGGNLSIKSWPGRSYDSDVIFYVNGGQLTMMNARLASGNPERADDEAQLIYVRGGDLQMGQNVNLEGRVVLDYRDKAEETEWEVTTASNAVMAALASYTLDSGDAVDSDAVGSDAAEGDEDEESSFDLNEYILDSDEGSMELVEDSMSASTWREPIIELLEGFDVSVGEYPLEILEDGSVAEIELVKTLYSDAETEEDFLSSFTLAENMDASWNLLVETQEAGQVRNTGLFSALSAAETLTQKTLLATRAGGKTIYWNPGGDIIVGGTTYYAGNDVSYSGLIPAYPVKTWEKAMALAEGGTVICMQTLNLGDSDADEYLAQQGDGSYLLQSSSAALMATLCAWESNPQPAILVPEGETLVIKDVELVAYNGSSAPVVFCNKGTIIIDENVTAETGYIQITAFKELEEPIKVTSGDASSGGTITLFFSGINDNFDYCYTDVVVPDGALAARIAAASDSVAEAVAVGLELQARFKLHDSHRDAANGGTSSFAWCLRPDTDEDDSFANPQNLELYTMYYFEAIYLNGEDGKGSDSYYGATCQYPVKTWAKAQERWAYEMEKSVKARRAAAAAGETAAYIEEFYPMPKTIYICGTVTVNSAVPEWNLEQALNPLYKLDYDGITDVTKVTEVVPHMDSPYGEDGVTLNHEIPEILVKVTGSGVLDINGVTFRNITDDADSVTLQVETGGKLTLKGDTHLTGKRFAKGSITAKEVTLGTHVKVMGGGSFIMGEYWKGSIAKRQHGVNASGSGAEVTMDGGEITENSSFEQDLYDAGQTSHKRGAGVLLSDQARFTMNGGKITKNSVYQYGAGVYMVDAGTSFIMNAGEISENKMHIGRISKTSTTAVRGYGIGIYAEEGTVLKIGTESAVAEAILITKNAGYLANGVGIWSDGELTIDQATIAENSAGGYSLSYSTSLTSYGIGIYVGGNGCLTMDSGQITGNYASNINSGYGSAQGTGIYFAAGRNQNSHTITESTISDNRVEYEYSNTLSYSAGGGIYVSSQVPEVTIKDSLIFQNQAYCGGGIYVSSTSSSPSTAMTIDNTKIQENMGKGGRYPNYGVGGGIYFNGYGSLTLLDGTEIIDNYAAQNGGGLYLTGSSSSASYIVRLYMMSETGPGAISINGNEAGSGSGGGIYHYNTIIHAKNAEINGNRAVSGGGIYVGSSGTGYFKEVTIGSEEEGNQATTGGGLSIGGGTYYMNDCVVADNTASGSGGGIYLSSGSIHLTETVPGNFNLSRNHADNGGGFYAASGTFYMDIAGGIQNSAGNQGSNLYLGSAAAYILAGEFKQPEEADRISGVYSIYIDDATTGSNKKSFDMAKIKVEKKNDADPDVIYLNTTNSYLTYLAAPLNDDFGTFPIDLNTDVFKPGSIVAKVMATSASANVNVTVLKPNSTLNGTASEIKAYGSGYVNASTKLRYFSGGKIPRRTQLGGFADARYSVLTNIVILGEGVYLSGSGNDDNGGTSPEDAVRTFTVAKQKLAEKIEDQRVVDGSKAEEDEKMGFSPFIYICGQVNVSDADIESDKTWELNYKDSLFTDTNKYYAIAETANEDMVYDAQVRRFASFVNAPMIKVAAGSVGSPVEFTTEKIIIDGMADAVITNDQSSNSPIIYGSSNSIVTLTGESRVTNNYSNGVDIYGTLILKGEEGESNKQLYNHHGYFVRLLNSAEVQMSGYARILADDEEKIGTASSYGIFILGTGTSASVSMEDNSSIEQASDSGLLAGGGIYSMYANTTIIMRDNAAILNQGNVMSYGILLTGQNSVLTMQDDANITATNNYITNVVSTSGADNQVIMEGNAKIRQAGTHTTSTNIYGVLLTGARSQISMKGEASIEFNLPTTSVYRYGIYTSAVSPRVNLQDDATITGSDIAKLNRGIYIAGGSDIRISMNDDGADGSSKIVNTTRGCEISGGNGIILSMGKRAEITKAANAIYLQANSSGGEISLEMKEDSKIHNNDYGVYFYGTTTAPVKIGMKDNAAIEQNSQSGISENASSPYRGISKFSLEMEGNSRISGNARYGIYLVGYHSFTEATGYHRISLSGSAVIGGEDYYSAAEGDSGNQYAGIYANSPIQLTMNGTSKISGNGVADMNNNSTTNGVYLTRRTDSYYRSGTAKITLNDNASICNNRGGVYVYTVSETTYPNYPNTCVIELNGIKEDGNLSSPSIQGNTDAIFLGRQGTLRLKGAAILGDTTYTASKASLDCYGYLELDGRSTIEGLIYLRDGFRPIVMTHRVLDPLREYKLHLTEGFLGQIVVKPGGDSAWDLTTPNRQITYFNKVSGDGLAATRAIVEDAPNLVLLGENNVYLSGTGSDSNTGNSRATAVRTFKRAKELLTGDLEEGEGGGYFTDGANIIICNSTVSVQAIDDDWSFGTGGYVTNEKSLQTWKPLVIRDEEFKGILVTLSNNADDISLASTVTFKDITIDGGSEQGIVLTTSANDQLLYIGTKGTAILGEGAVLQNNKAQATTYTNNSAIGVKVYRSTLQIDGGIIRNMVRGTTSNVSSSYFASAITCESNVSYPAKIVMNSGQIMDNELNYPNAYSTNARLGTICLSDRYSSMEMNGGLISNNKVVTRATNPAAAGALVIYMGSAAINGGIIRGNEGGYGSAIFYNGGINYGSSLILSGGQINGHTTNASAASGSASGAYSPIYIQQGDFQLKGGGTDMRENIYLQSITSLIKVSGHIYQANRLYRVYLPTAFTKGSVVVQPDGVNVTDVTPYLPYFDIRTNPYVLDRGRIDQTAGVNQSTVLVAGVKENQCLILMKAVYLDFEKGVDTRDGTTPAKAVKTFSQAKIRGQATGGTYNHYIIYVSGKAVNTAAETWSLPAEAYLCRYTGFPIYVDNNGTPDSETNKAYYGSLIEPTAGMALTLENIAIYGRRTVDTVTSNGDSLVRINSGSQVSVQSGTILADNYNIGNYPSPIDGKPNNLTSQGGAFHVAAGGELRMDDGVIKNTEAAKGSAIYLGASETDATDSGRGQLYLTGSPDVSGKVYLDGTGTATAAYVDVDMAYLPSKVLQISIGNDYSGRPVIRYQTGDTPGADELEYYLLDDAIRGMYDVVNNTFYGNILELELRGAIYLDGKDGKDSNDGKTPETAFRTLKKVYETIREETDTYGVVVFVVNTVDIPTAADEPAEIKMRNLLVKDSNGNSHYEGYYEDDNGSHVNINGQVYFKRYAQPKGYTNTDTYKGFNAPTLMDTLFYVKDGGTLTLEGIYLDGHSLDNDNSKPTLAADGVLADSPLVTAGEGGVLKCLLAEGSGISTATLFTNNINKKQKENSIGTLDSSDIMEGSSAGIELLGGRCELEATEFSNLQLGEMVIGGTDVYNNGDLSVSRETYFNGTVYLEGLGTADDKDSQDTSRYITVSQYGKPIAANFQVLMRDTYVHRTVVKYPDVYPSLAPKNNIAYYLLEDVVKDFFCLDNRSGEEYIFELQVPSSVYIDGINGNDDTNEEPEGRARGSVPKYPVKTLDKAFELLNNRSASTIYVVGTVQIDTNTDITGSSYIGAQNTVWLGSTNKVRITRYIQPDFVTDDPTDPDVAYYAVPDFTGVLLNVKDGAIASFGDGVYFDGHSKPKVNTSSVREYAKGEIVSEPSEAKAPMITVESGTLNLLSGTTLLNNNNTYADGDRDKNSQDGGAIANSGTVNVNGALFENNQAEKGSVVYQDGTFNIQSNPENLSDHKNAFYLTTANSGTTEAPVWGTDHVIRTAVAIPDEMVFDVDMDHAVKGRPVVRFTDSSAYSPDADVEHEHFKLGSSVKPDLFLVESETDPELLELQNWEILKVEVPASIYLVMSRKGTNDASTKLRGIMADAPAGDLLTAPEYEIKNKGNYDAKVSISGFENQTQDVGINVTLYPLMNLTSTQDLALSQTDLYLAVKGLDANGSGFSMAETSLKPYEEAQETTAPAVLGTLTPGAAGNFTFIGAVGSGFMNRYMDPDFPIEGSTGVEAQAYMDGTSSTRTINARAKYLLCYKVEIDPSRRESTAAPGSTTP